MKGTPVTFENKRGSFFLSQRAAKALDTVASKTAGTIKVRMQNPLFFFGHVSILKRGREDN
jgi:hypothetical protein